MFSFLKLFVLSLLFTTLANAQNFFPQRLGQVTMYRTTVGTTTAAAIPPASIGGNVYAFKICNDAENTSTHLLVGEAVDVSTDGVMLGKGQCFECNNCKKSMLEALKVEGQAAANGYSVIQYRE